jgi:alpha-N-acetylglucosaminidase
VTLFAKTPEGLTAGALDLVNTASVAPGETFTARFEISLTGDARELVSRLVVGATYAGGGRTVAPVRLLAASGVRDPYRTASFNDAVFGQFGDELAIEGAGADLWGGTNEFGAVYRAGAYRDGTTAAVRVLSQEATGGWARAGLIVRDDLATPGGGGYVNLAVTPSNGCVLTWDADGDGRFDSIAMAGSATASVHLRLRRDGGAYTGEYSMDGTTWVTVGTATPGGAGAAQDVGVFMTAANGWTGRRGAATFEGLTLE